MVCLLVRALVLSTGHELVPEMVIHLEQEMGAGKVDEKDCWMVEKMLALGMVLRKDMLMVQVKGDG